MLKSAQILIISEVVIVTEKQACTSKRYVVTDKDLPLSCPMDDQVLWDAHPRVYLPIEEEGRVVCPYCDAEYILKKDDESPQ
jgi:uncharacterized Zn-finger protein